MTRKQKIIFIFLVTANSLNPVVFCTSKQNEESKRRLEEEQESEKNLLDTKNKRKSPSKTLKTSVSDGITCRTGNITIEENEENKVATPPTVLERDVLSGKKKFIKMSSPSKVEEPETAQFTRSETANYSEAKCFSCSNMRHNLPFLYGILKQKIEEVRHMVTLQNFHPHSCEVPKCDKAKTLEQTIDLMQTFKETLVAKNEEIKEIHNKLNCAEDLNDKNQKKLRDDIADRDIKIKELNDYIHQSDVEKKEALYKNEIEIKELNDYIHQSDVEKKELNDVITDRNIKIKELNDYIHQSDVEKKEALYKNEIEIKELNDYIHQSDVEKKELNDVITDRNIKIKELNDYIHQSDVEKKELNDVITDRNIKIKELNDYIHQSDVEKKEALYKNEIEIKELNDYIHQSDVEKKELNDVITDRNIKIKELNDYIHQSDVEKKEALYKNEIEIKELNDYIHQSDVEKKELNDVITDRDIKIKELNHSLYQSNIEKEQLSSNFNNQIIELKTALDTLVKKTEKEKKNREDKESQVVESLLNQNKPLFDKETQFSQLTLQTTTKSKRSSHLKGKMLSGIIFSSLLIVAAIKYYKIKKTKNKIKI